MKNNSKDARPHIDTSVHSPELMSCLKLQAHFNKPIIFIRVLKEVVGLYVIVAECQQLSCLSLSEYHEHSKATDFNESGVSLDIVGRI